jgi:hypothetical protein
MVKNGPAPSELGGPGTPLQASARPARSSVITREIAWHRARSRPLEDGVAADSAPHHMRVTLDDRIAILERGAAVVRPGHFKDTWRAFHTFDPQTAPELPRLHVGDELANGGQKDSLLGGGQ